MTKKFFLRRKTFLLAVLLIGIQTLFIFPLLKPGVPITHDGQNHIVRFGAYIKAFQDAHVPPRWAGDLNFGYGTPVLNFFYPLPGYIGSFLYAFGFNLQDGFKILAGVSFIVAGLAFFVWLKEITDEFTAFVSACFYTLAPYHFLNLYVRGDIGELLAFAILPFVFWSIEKIRRHPSTGWIACGAFFSALLILSHNGVSLMFFPILFFYILHRRDNKTLFVRRAFLAIGLGLCISAFFWLPALIEEQYTHAALLIGSLYKEHFPKLIQLLWSPWGFGDDIVKPGGLSPQIGVVHLILLVAGLLLTLKESSERYKKTFWLWMFFFSIFMSLPISTFLWAHSLLLQKYEFPWRFIGIASFAIPAFLIQLFQQRALRPIFILSLALLILTSFSFTKVNGYENKSNSFYFSFPGTTYFHGEATTRWSAGDPGTFAEKPVEIIGGDAATQKYWHNSWRQKFSVIAQNNTQILVNTLYFPGWRVLVNGKKVPIEFQDLNHRGLITFYVPPGTSSVELFFGETPVRQFADIASLTSLLGLLFILVIRKGKYLL